MKKQLAAVGITAMIALSGCGAQSDDASSTAATAPSSSQGSSSQDSSTTGSGGSMGMEHNGSPEVPANLKEAANPKFKVGNKALIEADHMPGMKGAVGTITGAYDTTAYVVTYTPTTGGEPVKHHKWVIQQEIQGAGDEPFPTGASVVLEADHMPGMKGASATIESAERTTVYMLDYTPTTGGEPVKNHKWVTESELTAPK
ncbi:YdhK family protein [Paenibacillus sp. JX-17]|uniref:YdhK family protein n=1 Tax=Paenibacillus lacisoli TaxID=3064525 RepID=A0ABT9C9G4_9BACL|nr:YdhK family protein [Paenibacillus sp. JX-17]MDO7905304.1 YdhK family protein [Paenibacillus sp. JX-17]